MRVLVTGAAGYLGSALVRAIAQQQQADDRLLLADRVAPADPPHGADVELGEIDDPAVQERLFAKPVDVLFHLAGIVSGAAEADYVLGRRVNLDATLALLERCRRQCEAGHRPVRFVYASSIAVYGVPLPERIDDETEPRPTLSYGTHKRVCELLIDDLARRGLVDGRALRFSGVLVRPPLANGALSGFNSDVIREPLAGRTIVCPVAPEATIWVTSLERAIANLLRLAAVDGAALGARRALTTPSLALSVADVVAALGRFDAAAPARVSHRPDPRIEAQFGRWPIDRSFERAHALGLAPDDSIDAIIRRHLETA
jgi:nucleoside-diphosphate-sugar epimerase